MEEKKLASLVLRIGLAFVFIYVGIASFLNPGNWIGFLPSFLSGGGFLLVHNIVALLIGGWLLSGRGVHWASWSSGIFIFGVIVFNWGAFDIVFRDVAILGMAIALGILSKN
jgi:hypothetical protein